MAFLLTTFIEISLCFSSYDKKSRSSLMRSSMSVCSHFLSLAQQTMIKEPTYLYLIMLKRLFIAIKEEFYDLKAHFASLMMSLPGRCWKKVESLYCERVGDACLLKVQVGELSLVEFAPPAKMVLFSFDILKDEIFSYTIFRGKTRLGL